MVIPLFIKTHKITSKMTLKNRIEFAVFKTLLFLIKITPKSLIPLFGKGFGLLLYYLRIRRNVVRKNLDIAFGNQLTHFQKKRLARKTYINYGRISLEILLLNFVPTEKLNQYISIEGIKILEEAVSEGRGAIIAGNHFGNWETLSAGISSFGKPFHLYVGKQRNSLFDEAINSNRRRFGMSTISKSKTASIEMLKILKNNGILGMAGDLNVPHDKLFIDFFGKKASIGRGIPAFTVNQKAALLFIWGIRVGNLKHKGFIKRIHYDLTGDKAADVQQVAQLISNELEQKIREYPDQYFWFNRRWKTRPETDKEEVYP